MNTVKCKTIKAHKFRTEKITLEMLLNLHQWHTLSHLPLSAAEETQRTQAQLSGVVFVSGIQYLNKTAKYKNFKLPNETCLLKCLHRETVRHCNHEPSLCHIDPIICASRPLHSSNSHSVYSIHVPKPHIALTAHYHTWPVSLQCIALK